jgi:hypothetical protein
MNNRILKKLFKLTPDTLNLRQLSQLYFATREVERDIAEKAAKKAFLTLARGQGDVAAFNRMYVMLPMRLRASNAGIAAKQAINSHNNLIRVLN